MNKSRTALIVDDDVEFLATIAELVGALGYATVTAETLSAAKRIIDRQNFDHILLDLMLPDGSGLEFLDELAPSSSTPTTVTIITGHPAIRNSIKRIYGPNINYLVKPIALGDLKRILHMGGHDQDEDKPLHLQQHYGSLIGVSAAMQSVYEAIEKVAKVSVNVMLIGESGVGKELVAQAIHAASGRSGRFVPSNCGAFNRELIGSELFGHEKGAFTGASARKMGVFEQAAGGTLFLDEITEMPLELQPNLLRVIEAKNFVRLGGAAPIDVGCRIVSATNRSEQEMAEENLLREDLLYRLAAFPLVIPPLRERHEDVGLLTEFFLAEFNEEYGTELQCGKSTMERLQEYDWPGNVRELRHTIHRAYIMSTDGKELALPAKLGAPFTSDDPAIIDRTLHAGQTIEEVERNLIRITLDRHGGNKKQAATVLGISLKTLYNRLKSYEPESYHLESETESTQ